ncbi:MAG: bifunctional folylpolyglutamate synthase/dihydrofolate synthase, partial [Candidatus Acidiferrales bacterium]
ILRQAGLRIGLYTSPHLERINERIAVNGEQISDADFAAAFTRVHSAIEELLAAGPEAGSLAAHPTFFECVTAMAFHHFARKKLDFAVYEVGLGGRLDSTNIVQPEVSIITQIDFDHENYLGHSIEQIAGEKAGIIKPGVPVVCAAGRADARAVITRRAAELAAPLIDIDDRTNAGPSHLRPATSSDYAISLQPSLAGRFQLRNAITATVAALQLRERGLKISDEAISAGIAQTRWPGRLELIAEDPDVYFDGTHNPAGARELLAFWEEHLVGRRIVLIYGAVRDKAVDEITGLLFPRATHVICTQPRSARAISAAHLAEIGSHAARHCEAIADPGDALARALGLAKPDDVVFATGSRYLVGDLRRWWRAHRPSVIPSEARNLWG